MPVDLRVPRAVVEDLSGWDLVWAVIEPAFKRVDTASEYDVLAMQLRWLTTGQRAILSTYWLDAEVRNGGFQQFLWNTTGGVALDAVEGFAVLEATKCSELAHDAVGVLPGLESRSWRHRQRLLDQHAPRVSAALRRLDERYLALQEIEPLDKLAFTYVEQHLHEFVADP